ncbi:uncharacterized protein [Antedon mediterranea]|uniref:uncharacterized protein n=1 Tax=Antedon mediterranea TaxID=105859 RepID=UPI003AF487DC
MEKDISFNLPHSPQSLKENIPLENDYLGMQGLHNESQGRPQDSYAQMIAKAIKTSGSNSATLQEIYDFITSRYPYYCENRMHWKNSVRHNLTVQKDLFRRIPTIGNEPEARGCSRWTFVDGFEELLIKRQKRRNPSLRTPGQKHTVRSRVKKVDSQPVEKQLIMPPTVIKVLSPIQPISPPDSPASLSPSVSQENHVMFNDPYFTNLTPASSVSPTDSDSSVFYQDFHTKTHFVSTDINGCSLLDSLISGEVLPGELSPYKEDFYPSPPKAVPVSINKNEPAFRLSELTPLSNLDVFYVLGNERTYDRRGICGNLRYCLNGTQAS